MNQRPSFPGSGSYEVTEAPVFDHADIAGRLQIVLPTGENEKVVVPLTRNWR
jgi:hypothetical protein